MACLSLEEQAVRAWKTTTIVEANKLQLNCNSFWQYIFPLCSVQQSGGHGFFSRMSNCLPFWCLFSHFFQQPDRLEIAAASNRTSRVNCFYRARTAEPFFPWEVEVEVDVDNWIMCCFVSTLRDNTNLFAPIEIILWLIEF